MRKLIAFIFASRVVIAVDISGSMEDAVPQPHHLLYRYMWWLQLVRRRTFTIAWVTHEVRWQHVKDWRDVQFPGIGGGTNFEALNDALRKIQHVPTLVITDNETYPLPPTHALVRVLA